MKQDFNHVKHPFCVLVVLRQIREAGTPILECNPMNVLRIAEITVKDSEALEYYIKNDEKIAKKNEETASEYSRMVRKIKKRKLSYYHRLQNESKAKIYKEYYKKNETTVPSHLIPKNRPEEAKQEYQL